MPVFNSTQLPKSVTFLWSSSQGKRTGNHSVGIYTKRNKMFKGYPSIKSPDSPVDKFFGV
ncbi:hypothetical protein ADIS_3610 [Lunatimonas lonarensis]|uniref:Uncharacterized protein n=1 Tax=Lunatimonas lonarensis TaxID=1232681 RepID=R7ZP88_9BACT|nr:hypothetical protein ADIS_3610 [Lunatimonas lonarensis]